MTAKLQKYHRDRVARKLSIRECIRCNIPVMPTSNAYCEKHYFKTVSKSAFGTVKKWNEIKNLLEAQDYRCALTGEKLVLGVNDSLDHIMPKSRTTEWNTLSNVRWVTRQVNTVKNNLTDRELILLLEKIKAYTIAAMCQDNSIEYILHEKSTYDVSASRY